MKIRAYAKINLLLDILGKRQDGYHLLDMIMQTVSLYDDIDISLNDSGKITVSSSDNALGGENDITYKAAKLFLDFVGSDKGVSIKTEKHIPVAAGLGGGSSDAAAVITALNKLLDTDIPKNQLEALCLKLGADVPYFLYGGTKAVGGIGEILKPLAAMPESYIVIVKYGEKASTGEIYRKIDAMENIDHPQMQIACKMLEKSDLKGFSGTLKNVFGIIWDMELPKQIMEQNGALTSLLTGSGPSYFGIFETEKQAQNAVDAFKEKGIAAYLVKPVAVPNSIIE
ncbi:MAG: 4-(cytidine 5'-diphospho)-2-C-methyl-D-erythritol kinase [Clostridiales bacterium]|nr:4-(cytidine 5'-diphospho)-2-C-methyl-D-erythritol kinase [Candidatus Equinaster intestinalis]